MAKLSSPASGRKSRHKVRCVSFADPYDVVEDNLEDDLDMDMDFSDRTTMTVQNASLLRATYTATLLEGYGKRLRSTSGGIGIAEQTSEDLFERSFPVNSVDVFLSHSWHANWWLKYLTLLFYYNLVPAVTCSTLVGAAACYLRLLLARKGCHSIMPSALCKLCICMMSGLLSFFVVLLSWHHFLISLPKRFRSRTVFLDKVCIHQTNMALKAKGIKAIGGILSNSHKLLVAWDSTYFNRLWCCYEMSAFMCAHAKSRGVVILPVSSGGLTLFVILSETAMQSTWIFIALYAHLSAWEARIVYMSVWFARAIFITCYYTRHLQAIAALHDQMATFSVLHAECFCCKNGHINPIDGNILPCDRQVVYKSIVYWLGADSLDDGLRVFDRMIRGSFRSYVYKALGSSVPIPYSLAVAAGNIMTLAAFDYHSINANHHSVIGQHVPITDAQLLANALNFEFLFLPLQLGMLMFLIQHAFVGKIYRHLGAAAVSTLLNFLLLQCKDLAFSCLADSGPRWPLVLFLSFEAVGVWWLFFAKRSNQHYAMENKGRYTSQVEMQKVSKGDQQSSHV